MRNYEISRLSIAVIKALNNASFNGRKINVEEAGDTPKASKPSSKREQTGGDGGGGMKKKNKTREERGYSASRGPKKKDDWRQFFEQPEPDFSEEGWARRKPKKE